ncbi:lipoprotein [Martelella alba]|uniref:Lipoprotein n=1 Tax=Martelella alba TaxID=2590451 RepID=A0ABY2SUZ5_9HYPH|nr:lipoprotein [Martelella alba]TKI08259.1 lipoprotein [Martelella alba]
MKKRILTTVILLLSVLLTGCNKLTEYRLSEQDINHYLQEHNDFKKSIGVQGLLNADIVLTGLSSQIGRNEPDKVRVSGDAKVNIQTLWGSRQADVKLILEAQPFYDRTEGAVYLKGMQLVDYQVQPDKLQSTFKVMAPYLNQALTTYFDAHPAYVLDANRSKTEALAKKLAKGLEVEPGELVIPFVG